MNPSPSISVITINFNNRQGLDKTMRSVLSQSLHGVEYLVIDGGSDDGSRELIMGKADKLSYWVSEKDSGIYNAMNKGIRKATGQYLLFLNSGDSFVSDTVLEQMLQGEDGTIDLLYGDLHRTFPDGTEDVVPMPDFVTVDQMLNWTLCHPVTLIHRRLFEDFGLYDERLKIVADWAFFFKVIILGNATQKHKPVTVSSFCMDGMSSLEANNEKIHQEREWVKATYLSPAFKKMYAEYSIYKNLHDRPWIQQIKKWKRRLEWVRG